MQPARLLLTAARAELSKHHPPGLVPTRAGRGKALQLREKHQEEKGKSFRQELKYKVGENALGVEHWLLWFLAGM